MQEVVRTAPTRKGYYYDPDRFAELQSLLRQGYKVLMCNKIGDDLEYILDKEDGNGNP